MQRIGGRRPHNNSRAVLVIMEHRNIHAFTAEFFDDKTIGCLDILKVDRPKGRLQRGHNIGQFFGVAFVHLDIETIDIGEFLEQNRLALHHRLGGQRADIAKPQHRGAIADHSHQIAARCVFLGRCRIGLDFKAGFGHAGGIGAAQVAAIGQRFGGTNFQLSGLWQRMIIQCRLPCLFLRFVVHTVPGRWLGL